ncbi:hypothetical protein [Leekyejoonella antrihumi]|uniref:Uncharacterized protein n=1 Tax=Leekyejoonella antrihumi TaxID=1660198 RepID=A0A563DPL6_9MICO|nr:hypothetical protein [Leekyejoonella antrihumi]TWP31704.1 hypothetical protein FGL98_25035 [Leekyejoonella antrihumi]
MLIALAHSGGVPSDVPLLTRAADPELAADTVYAAGMSDHRDLPLIATATALDGTTAQASARWWQHTGPAITDSHLPPGGHPAPARRPDTGRAPGVAWAIPSPAHGQETRAAHTSRSQPS